MSAHPAVMRLRRPPAGDVMIGVVLAVATLVGSASGGLLPGPTGSVDVGAVLLAVAVAVSMSLRRRLPMTVLIATNAVTAAWYLLSYPGRLVTFAALIACYTVAAQRGWRWGLVGCILTAGNGVLVIHFWLRVGWFADPTVNALAMSVSAAALGAALHYHRAFAAGAAERAERIAEARAEAERRRAAERRLEIARDLHDVFGHTMATISVQAGVAAHLTERDPDQAARALRTIKTVSDEGLAEVQVLLGLLRVDGTPAVDGLARLDQLLEVTRTTGTPVDLAVRGDPRALPARVNLAAFRILQESLTNARRHAPGSAVRVSVDYGRDVLELVVANEIVNAAAPRNQADALSTATGPPATPAGGHGIAGMRARATALGGSLAAGPTDAGEFEVRGLLPLEDPGAQA